jgi:hypothetical protein
LRDPRPEPRRLRARRRLGDGGLRAAGMISARRRRRSAPTWLTWGGAARLADLAQPLGVPHARDPHNKHMRGDAMGLYGL